MESTEGGAQSPESATSELDGRNLGYEELVELYDESMRTLVEGEIVEGTVIAITSNEVIVDVGYKSEGLIPIDEFTDRDGEL